MRLRHRLMPGDSEVKVLDVLRHRLKLSSTMVKRLKLQGSIFKNGLPARTNEALAPGDLIEVLLPPSQAAEHILPEKGSLEILFEDEYMIALNKPQGLISHPSRSRISGTLSNLLLGYFQSGGQALGLHPVTRLDRDTGGLVLFAKNSYVHSLLSAIQRERRLKRQYEALVLGLPRPSGLIERPIRRACPQSMIRIAVEDGLEALTAYELEKSYRVFGENISVLRLFPLSGRTHQLRVHCLAGGFPILGDPIYKSPLSEVISQELGLCRQQLFALRLDFEHPVTGERLSIALPASS